MHTLSILVDDIEIGGRHRALSDDAVQRLAGSMKDNGLRQPITIRITDDVLIDGKPCDGVPVLVAGRHRLAAAKSLGWSHIDCFEVDDDAISAEMWEIAENLHRFDLTKEQRDEHIRRYVELRKERDERQPQQNASPVLSDGRKSGPQHSKGVARQVAEETGLSVDTIRRALKPKPAPRELVEVVDPFDVITAQADAIVRAWNRACPEARQMAMEQIDAPVMDRAA